MPLDRDAPNALNDELVSDEATTQENSPRRPSPQKPQVNDITENHSSPDSTSLPRTLLPHLEHESIRIPGQSAVVSWFSQQRQEYILNHDVASAFIQYDVKPKNTAFFRLRVKVGVTSRRTPKHVYLFIPPEYIQTLSLRDHNEAPQLGSKTKAAIRRAVGTAGVVCLSFEMRKPCLLVGPKDLDPSSPQSNENQSSHIVNMLDTVKQLSSQKSFVVHLPCTAVPQGPLLSMCQAVSSPGLLVSEPTLNDINGLYGGRGGIIIGQRPNLPGASIDRLDPQHATPDNGLPPAYEQAGPAPPPAFTPTSKDQPRQAGNKRRRATNSELSAPATSSKFPVEAVELPSTTLDMIMARMEQGFGQINTRLTTLETRIGGIESRLTQLEAQSARQPLDESLDDLRYDLEKQIGELREEAEDLLENKVEEGISDAKRELTDYMEDQVDSAKGDIMRKLAESSVQCSINFDFS